MVPLSVVGLVIFGFGAANALSAVAIRVSITSAIPSAILPLEETGCEFKRAEVMA
jgi:hypothetical protein